MDLKYFNEVEKMEEPLGRRSGRRRPILSKLVNYDWLKEKDVLDIAVGSGFSLVSLPRGRASN